jgi:hypothetical protein
LRVSPAKRSRFRFFLLHDISSVGERAVKLVAFRFPLDPKGERG